MKKWLRRSGLAKALGIPSPTIKYYTALGLFPISKKTVHGQYLYDYEQIQILYEKIRALKDQRWTIEEIKNGIQNGITTEEAPCPN
jgi:DNA-binding transcriptional MerR regulator